MNNKGFTLVEVLTALVIGTILGTIAIVGTKSVLETSKDKYQTNQEKMIVLATKEYYSDHKNELPMIEEEQVEISLEKLETEDYIDKVKDAEGNTCSKDSKITVKREENGKYKYNVSLVCKKEKA